MTPEPKQRLDKWLWHARFFKTRTLAAKVVEGGHCRLNRVRVRKPGHAVKAGDVLTFPQGRLVRVIEVKGFAERRGPAADAVLLYRDLDPPAPPAARTAEPAETMPSRERGAGRPTKKDRRSLEKVTRQHD